MRFLQKLVLPVSNTLEKEAHRFGSDVPRKVEDPVFNVFSSFDLGLAVYLKQNTIVRTLHDEEVLRQLSLQQLRFHFFFLDTGPEALVHLC